MRIPARLLAPLGALVLLAAPSAAAAQSSDKEQVLATIAAFTEALRAKDTVGMAANLDDAARMTLLRPSPNGGVRVVTLAGKDFIRQTTGPNSPAIDEPIRNPVVQIDADLATVWAEYQVRIAGKVSHCGYDAFHLVRSGGKWKILNVSDTFRQTGCGEMWK